MTDMPEQIVAVPSQTQAMPPKAKPRKLVMTVVLIAAGVVVVLGAAVGFTYAVYIARSENVVVRAIADVLPIPAAKVGTHAILYREYLKTYDTVKTFVNSKAAKDQKLNVPIDANLAKSTLEKLIYQEALSELAEQKKVTVTDEELRAFFTDVVSAASSTTPDVGVYLLDNFGWNEEDFRQNVLRPALLEQKLGTEMMNENGGDSTALATYMTKRLSDPDVVRYLRF